MKKISNNYPKYLLTLDELFGTADYEGIKKVNVLDWLLVSNIIVIIMDVIDSIPSLLQRRFQ